MLPLHALKDKKDVYVCVCMHLTHIYFNIVLDKKTGCFYLYKIYNTVTLAMSFIASFQFRFYKIFTRNQLKTLLINDV